MSGRSAKNDLRTDKTLPPEWIFRVLRLYCPAQLYEEIEGDLLQRFQKDVKKLGIRRAKARLIWSVVRFFRPGILLRNKFSFPLILTDMIINYIKIAFRSFQRQKAYSFLNVFGLALGLAASLMIIQYVKYERSFDRFHNRAQDIYRIQYNGYQNGQLNFESAVAVPAIGPFITNNFPEAEAFTRLLSVGGVITYDKPGQEPISFREKQGYFADTILFKIFDFKVTQADRKTCLKGLNKIILSESAAKRYFQDEDPIGKRLTLNGGDYALEVSGIFSDIPENSHLKFDYLISYETLNARFDNNPETSWGWYDYYTYVLLKPHTDVQQLQSRLNDQLVKARKEEWDKYNYGQEFLLRPLTDIHLYSHLLYEASPQDLRDGDSIYALSFIAFFILAIAWINYVNLATARSFKRANEVGIRKVMGAFRKQLVGQFLIESFILNVLAGLLALAIVRLSWRTFADLTGWHMPIDFMFHSEFWLLLLALFAGGAVLSGFYPAIILSSFKPVLVLKGKINKSSTGNFLRVGLVGFQFVATAFLISGSLIVYQQLQFMKNSDLGVNLDQTLVINGPKVTDSLYQQTYSAFKTEALRISGVKGITASTNIPGEENYWTTTIRRLNANHKGAYTSTNMAADHEFIPQYGIKILAGRNFDINAPSDKRKIILNRSLARELEFSSPQQAVGEKATIDRDTFEILAVVEDFHQMSLQSAMIPLIIRLHNPQAFYSLKLETDNYPQVIEALRHPWETSFAGNPMDYFFLDQFYNRQYAGEDRFSEVFTVFTALAIFIASMGLLGLASFMASQRTREIGIRKVMGSSVSGIILLLSKSFMKPVFAAIIIACPIGWWLMDQWLQSFPYRISIQPWIFLLSSALVVTIAFLSVASQTLRAALTKPADTLKYE